MKHEGEQFEFPNGEEKALVQDFGNAVIVSACSANRRVRLSALEELVTQMRRTDGLISPGLFAVVARYSRERVYQLIDSGKLRTETVAGARMIVLQSAVEYARSFLPVSSSEKRKSAMRLPKVR